ncbi:MAG: hypothetical protein LC754_10240 [Acidobacteria bacterium]|nr:hypothetical protein [Acidobacteriota bacterium]
MSSNSDINADLKHAGEDARAGRLTIACPACGGAARRDAARYCATCGRRLNGEDYFPTDTLRASYHQQRAPRHPTLKPAASCGVTRPVRRQPPVNTRRARTSSAMPLTANQNGASTTALAFVTYALVPYLGILFCPGALLCGSVGLVRSVRAPHIGGRRASATSIVLGVLILGAQLVLWWILYKVPEWSRGAAGF